MSCGVATPAAIVRIAGALVGLVVSFGCAGLSTTRYERIVYTEGEVVAATGPSAYGRFVRPGYAAIELGGSGSVQAVTRRADAEWGNRNTFASVDSGLAFGLGSGAELAFRTRLASSTWTIRHAQTNGLQTVGGTMVGSGRLDLRGRLGYGNFMSVELGGGLGMTGVNYRRHISTSYSRLPKAEYGEELVSAEMISAFEPVHGQRATRFKPVFALQFALRFAPSSGFSVAGGIAAETQPFVERVQRFVGSCDFSCDIPEGRVAAMQIIAQPFVDVSIESPIGPIGLMGFIGIPTATPRPLAYGGLGVRLRPEFALRRQKP